MTEKKIILVIDDNLTDLKLISSVLMEKGYDVVISNEAPAGVEKTMAIKPALIVLDVMMPIINGYNICRLLKEQEETSHLPILLLTSRNTEEDFRIGKEVGADAYITKPFKTAEFLDAVNRLLNQ